ncbi:MAG: type III polyketide synthase [Bacteroidia bacterium]|nr:type III polyketide synthase [Bacteroidia bacterium]NNJ55481.1 type III polyketide synthase [Bacteroidia bacterium]
MGYIIDIGTAVPETFLSQDEFFQIYSAKIEDEDIRRKLRFLIKRSAISKRHCVDPNISALTNLPLEQKLSKYHNSAVSLAKKAIINNPAFEENKDNITDIVFISCTGLQAPGVEIDLIEQLELSSTIKRYNITFMGCYAALTGLRLANEICTSSNRCVLVVSVELCTLHFQNKSNDDYLLSNSLFADGAASAIVKSVNHKAKYKLSDFESRIIPQTKNEMSWKVSPSGFLMTLSSDVPKSIKESLNKKYLFDRNPKLVDWAIHPGGKQIIDGISSILNLEDTDVETSRAILKSYGNMSSATILFVLKKLLDKPESLNNEIIACAFGPGLTLESALLEYV